MVKNNESITLEAYDKDVLSSDLLGVADPIDFIDYASDDKVHEHKVEIFQKTG
jgi:hypothetical protein